MVWLISGWVIFVFSWMWFGYERFINQSTKEPNGWILLVAIQVLGLIAMFAFKQFPLFFAASLAAALYVRTYFGKSLI